MRLDLEINCTLAFAYSTSEYTSEYFVYTFFVPAFTETACKFRVQN